MFRFVIATFLTVSIGLEVSATCCKDHLSCWETCMIPPGGSSRQEQKAYTGIHQMIRGIKAIYAPCDEPHGTAYMMDAAVPNQKGATPDNIWAFQRHLASIVSISQSVGDTCNPFCTSKYFKNFGYFVHSWVCKDRCKAARVLNSQSFKGFTKVDSTPSWVGGGEILAKSCFNRQPVGNFKCMANTTKELLLSFTNSPIRSNPPSPSYCDSLYHCAVIGTSTSIYTHLSSWAHPGSVYLLPADNVHMGAARDILKCMNWKCCNSDGTFPLRSLEEMEEESEDLDVRTAREKLTFNYVSGSSQTPKKYDGTAEAFENFAKIIMDRESGFDIVHSG